MMAGAPISFGANTRTLTAQATVESELIAFGLGGKKATYLFNFLKELTFTPFGTVPMKSKSTGALHFAGNSTGSWRAKHIALRFFFLREMLADIATRHLVENALNSIMQHIKGFSRSRGVDHQTGYA